MCSAPNLFKLKIPYTSMLSDRGMRAYLRSHGPRCRFDDLPFPLAVVAADVLSQRELVLRRGIVWQAVLASIAIPGIYPAQRIGPHVAVDGGVLNPLPVNVAAEMGAGTLSSASSSGAAIRIRSTTSTSLQPRSGRLRCWAC